MLKTGTKIYKKKYTPPKQIISDTNRLYFPQNTNTHHKKIAKNIYFEYTTRNIHLSKIKDLEMNFLKKIAIKTLALTIKDKEERKLWRKNKLHPEQIALKGHSYKMKPCFGRSDTVIGKYVSIAENVTLGLGVHLTDNVSTSPLFSDKNDERLKQQSQPIVIKNDVWIGKNAMIKNGLTIGNGAVIGAGAIVTKDVPDYAIVAGVPAKIIRYRFSPEIREKLLQSQWWDYPYEKLKKLPYKDPEKFLEELQKIKD